MGTLGSLFQCHHPFHEEIIPQIHSKCLLVQLETIYSSLIMFEFHLFLILFYKTEAWIYFQVLVIISELNFCWYGEGRCQNISMQISLGVLIKLGTAVQISGNSRTKCPFTFPAGSF